MQGTFRGAETRAWYRDQWAQIVIPDLIRDEVAPLAQLLPETEDLVAIDVGANKGWWTAALLRTFPGKVRHVHMIDASPENFRELSNARDHLTLSPDELWLTSAYPFAMSSGHGSVTLHTDEDGSPLASIYPGVTRGWGEAGAQLSTTITVPTDTVDAFMERQRLGRVSILKVDVEGHEMAVFEGASKALSDKAIDVVAFEFGLHQVQSRHFFVDFFDLFSGRYGYRMYTAENGVLSSIPSYSFDFENLSRQYVMYAVADRGPPAPVPVSEPPPGVLDRLRRRLSRGLPPKPE